MKKYDTKNDKLDRISSISFELTSLSPFELLNEYSNDRNEYLNVQFGNIIDILKTIGRFLFFSCEDFRNEFPLNYTEFYILREKILRFYGNDFSNHPFIYFATIPKPELLFDLPKFFVMSRMTNLRFVDDFINELITDTTIYPSCTSQTKSIIFLDDLMLYSFRFIAIPLDILISNIYKLSNKNYEDNSSKYIFSRDLLEQILKSEKQKFTHEDIKIMFELCYESSFGSRVITNFEDKLLDISEINPEESYFKTLLSIIEYSNNFDDEILKTNFELFCLHSLNDDNIYPSLKFYKLSTFVKTINKSCRFSQTYINKKRFREEETVNLYILNKKNSISVDFEYDINNEDFNDREIVKVFFTKILKTKELMLSEIEKFLNYCSSNFNIIKKYLIERNISEVSIAKLYDYHIFFVGSCLYNSGFCIRFLKKTKNRSLFNRSIDCFTNMLKFFVERKKYIDILEDDRSEDFHREVIFSTLCCSFYNANFDSKVNFIDFAKSIQDKILDRISYNLSFKDLFSGYLFFGDFYSFSENVCEQIELFFDIENSYDEKINDDIENYHFPSSVTFKELSDNILLIIENIHQDIADLISLQFLLSSSYFKSYSLAFNCYESENFKPFFEELIEKGEKSDIEILRSFKDSINIYINYDIILNFIDIDEEYSRFNKLSPFSLNKLKGTIADIQSIDEKIYIIIPPSNYVKLLHRIPDTNKIFQFKTFPINILDNIEEEDIEIKNLLIELQTFSTYEDSELRSRCKFFNMKPKEYLLKDCSIFNSLIDYMISTTQKDKFLILEKIADISRKISGEIIIEKVKGSISLLDRIVN